MADFLRKLRSPRSSTSGAASDAEDVPPASRSPSMRLVGLGERASPVADFGNPPPLPMLPDEVVGTRRAEGERGSRRDLPPHLALSPRGFRPKDPEVASPPKSPTRGSLIALSRKTGDLSPRSSGATLKPTYSDTHMGLQGLFGRRERAHSTAASSSSPSSPSSQPQMMTPALVRELDSMAEHRRASDARAELMQGSMTLIAFGNSDDSDEGLARRRRRDTDGDDNSMDNSTGSADMPHIAPRVMAAITFLDTPDAGDAFLQLCFSQMHDVLVASTQRVNKASTCYKLLWNGKTVTLNRSVTEITFAVNSDAKAVEELQRKLEARIAIYNLGRRSTASRPMQGSDAAVQRQLDAIQLQIAEIHNAVVK